MTAPLLDVQSIDAGYGTIQVLRAVSFHIGRGEVATLIGRNGMGKTTTIRAVTGQLRLRGGSIRFAGEDISRLPDYRIAQAGIGLVPEGRAIFPDLTVRENLVSGAANRHRASDPWTLERVYHMFPRLQERSRHLGSQLSGGEQQMVAIGRALMTNPRLLILDEATEGLAPLVRRDIWNCLAALKQTGLSMLVVDKNLASMAKIADRHCALEKGKVAWQGDAAAFATERSLIDRYVTVAGRQAAPNETMGQPPPATSIGPNRDREAAQMQIGVGP
jgi:branched-chain amino acid transport system ATP-binding protein